MRSRSALLALVAAVNATPYPQAVTAAIAPPAAAPSGCMSSYDGAFAVAVVNVSHALVDEINGIAPKKGGGSSVNLPSMDGSMDAPNVIAKVAALGGVAKGAAPQHFSVVSQIGDGQIQAPVYGTPGDQGGGVAGPVAGPVAEPAAGPVAGPVAETVAGPLAASAPAPNSPAPISAPTLAPEPPVPTPSDEPTTTMHITRTITRTVHGVPSSEATPLPASLAAAFMSASDTEDGQVQARARGKRQAATSPAQVTCKTNGTLALKLDNGILKDARGWTGYIASNYQFQFDDPPQAGSIYTAGWSMCSNGSLALGGSAIFWQCRSGDFYNLYDRYWAPQCNPITINALQLQDC